MSYATFDAIKIGIASPDKIREWSYGEVNHMESMLIIIVMVCRTSNDQF